jgi:hypothetical protein
MPLWGAEQQHPAATETGQGAGFMLTRQGDRLLLSTQQASLRDILKTLGTMLAIEVVARIPQATTVTLDVAGLSLHGLLQRLRPFANIVSLTESTQPASKITKMIVLPIHGAQRLSPPTVSSGAAPPLPPYKGRFFENQVI